MTNKKPEDLIEYGIIIGLAVASGVADVAARAEIFDPNQVALMLDKMSVDGVISKKVLADIMDNLRDGLDPTPERYREMTEGLMVQAIGVVEAADN